MTVEIVAAMIAVTAGAFTQTTIGFGLAIVSAPLLFYLDPLYVPAPITLAALTNCIFTTLYYRSHLSLRGMATAMVARVPGSLVGVGLLKIMSVKMLALVIAAVIGLGMWINYRRYPLAFNQRNLAIAGFLSGVMGTATSIGGPPMAVLMQSQQANSIRGNLAAFFIFSCLVSLVVLAPAGYVGKSQLWLSVPLIPASLLGSWLGARFGSRVNDKVMRIGSLVLCGVSVAGMLIQHVF